MDETPAVKLTIHFGAASRYAQSALSSSLMAVLGEHNLAGATMIYGAMGYGRSRRIYPIMDEGAMTNLPLTIEVVDERDKIERIVPFVVEMLARRGLVQVQQTTIIRNPAKSGGVRARSES